MNNIYVTFMFNPDTKIETITGAFKKESEAKYEVDLIKITTFCSAYYKIFVEKES